MARPLSTPWPTARGTVFFDDLASAPTLRRAVNAGRIRRLASHIYTADLETPAADLVVANVWEIVAHLMPDAVVVDRTAAAGGAVAEGMVVVASDRRRSNLELPGLTVVVRPLERCDDDSEWVFGLQMSSPARTVADNLRLSRSVRGRAPRTLTRMELTTWVKQSARTWVDPAAVFAAARELAQRNGDLDDERAALLANLALAVGERAEPRSEAVDGIGDEALAVLESAVLALGGSLRRVSEAEIDEADGRVQLLQSLHSVVADLEPGQFRTEPNRLPSLELVDADEVETTLRYGLALVSPIRSHLARAVGVMFVVLVVDPFADATAEVAMLALNAELRSHGHNPVIIPRELTDRFERAKRQAVIKGEVGPLLDVVEAAVAQVADTLQGHGL